jgi:beta-glucosidase
VTDTDALLARMTFDEKVAQLGCVWSTFLVENDAFSEVAAARMLAHGIGEITRIGASTGLVPEGRAAFANAIQRYLVEHTRLGIPAIVHEESTAGLCARDATQFPQAIGLAATWDPGLLERIGSVIREQMVATGARHTLAPVLDIARDPRWGRTEETYGESAYLTSRLGVAYVRGVQGTLRGGVAATGKHFLGYGFSEGGMNHAPVHVGARELREVFAEPFRAAIAEANLATVMNSYASVDGIACGGSKVILDALLRGELGFTGTVVADYFTTGLLISHHRVAATKAEAARRALTAGLDMELPSLDCYPELTRDDEELVDRSVRRVLQLKDALGLFDDPFVDERQARTVYGRSSDRALAREAAASSIVLLKNDGVLPLHDGMRVAVIGPNADSARALQGDYSYPAHTEITWKQGTGGTIAPQAGSAFKAGPYFPESVTALAGIASRATVADDPHDADVVVCVVGGTSGLMAQNTSGEFRDATDLELPAEQVDLVRTAASTGIPTVVVVMSGRVHTLENVLDHASALAYAWCPGEQGGAGLADVLFGVVAPSGRLPITIPRTVGQVPIHHDHRAGGGRSQMLGDYVDCSSAPRFSFGFGLSYTTFAYENLRVAAPLTVTVDVRNTGTVAGIEVVQLFVRDEYARVARPAEQLAGFARVALDPGDSRTVRFTVDPTLLAYYDEDMQLVVEPGDVRVTVGDQHAVAPFAVEARAIQPNDRRPTTVELLP